MARRWWCLAISCGLAASGVSGCASTGSEEVSPGMVEAAGALANIPPEIEIAQALLVQDCVRQAGFDMPFDSSASRSNPVAFGIANVFDSADQAKRLGYSSTISQGDGAEDTWVESLSAQDRERYYSVLLGPEDAEQGSIKSPNGVEVSFPKEGCIAEARTQLYGSAEDAAAFYQLINEYLAAAHDGSEIRKSRLAPLVPTYEECMRDQGYDVEALGAQKLAEQLFGTYRSPGDPPSTDEQELAVQDFHCQQSIELQTVLAEAFAQSASDWIKANQGKLLSMQEKIKEVKKRAIQVING